jgi:GNAT superfamily N-acetyltransferase
VKETELFKPIKTYLEGQGYRVSSEVQECDIVATKDRDIVIVELKTRFSVSLLIQAVKRKEITDSVYAAIPVPVGRVRPPNLGGIKKLLRRLEIGLILVDLLKTKTKIEIVLHPRPFLSRQRPKKRAAIIREINGRYAEFNMAGSPSKQERITAYKQEAIKIAYLLRTQGAASARKLVDLGTGNKTQRILSQNNYGWFDRIRRGTYQLNRWGEQALAAYPRVVDAVKQSLPDVSIRSVSSSYDIERSVYVIQASFETAARRFGLNPSNCPTHPSLVTRARLVELLERGTEFFGLFKDGLQVGFVAAERSRQDAGTYFLEKLSVLPRYRHRGYGGNLVRFVFKFAGEHMAKRVSIGIIDDDAVLKSWYLQLGFVEKGTKCFEHLPFVVCFMEKQIV